MNKLTELTVKDFQSFKSEKVPLGQFTAIVGGSNLGKSALLRALKALAHNAASPGLVRQGSKEFEASVSFEDGTKEVLTKGAKISKFELDSNVFAKAGANSVPDEIAELWNLSDLSFTSQHDKPFLLAEPASEVARVLGELTNASLLMEAVRETNRLRSEALNTVKARDKEAEECRSQILTHSGLTAKLDYLGKAREEYAKTLEIDTAYQALKRLIDVHNQISTSLSAVNPIPEFDIDLDELDSLLTNQRILSQFIASHESLEKNLNTLEPKIKNTQDEINEAHSTIHELMQQAGYCPYCERGFDE